MYRFPSGRKRKLMNMMLTTVYFSLVSLLFPSFRISSITRSTRLLNGPSEPVFVLMVAKQPSAHCQARAFLLGKKRKSVLRQQQISPGTSTRLSENERVSSVVSQVRRPVVVESHHWRAGSESLNRSRIKKRRNEVNTSASIHCFD
jgi:hypothetical protein